MLKSLQIAGYRGFERYALEDFRRVNLLVGRNNCGKTALLESVQFLASGGNPEALVDAAVRRGEVIVGRGEVIVGRPDEQAFLDISHFFNGHHVNPDSQLSLKGEGDGQHHVTVKVVALGDVEPNPELFTGTRTLRPAMAMRIETGKANGKPRTFFLSSEGAFLVDPRRPYRRFLGEDRSSQSPPVHFIAPDSVEPRSLSEMWNQVLLEGSESEVIKAMRLLEPGIASIVFLTGESVYRYYGGRAIVHVSFGADQPRLPLGSYGDGMRRLLALSISLIRSKGGYLIIDEIDTGFHYSIMPEMWKLVIQTASESSIQVFATTHSLDCLKGLAVMVERNPELQDQLAVHKIERGIPHSVPFIGKDILTAVKQGVEVR